MLEVRDVRHAYGAQQVLAVPALSLQAGASGLLLGPSGSGKTTLLNILCGLLKPSQGTVMLKGQDLWALKDAERDVFRGKHIALVPQKLHLIGALTVMQNVLAAQYMANEPQDPERVKSLLSALGLAEKAAVKPARLSHGQAQRAAIARAAVNRPALILADEPTSNLDDGHARMVADLLADQAAACGAALLVATHDKRLIDRFPTVLSLEAGA